MPDQRAQDHGDENLDGKIAVERLPGFGAGFRHGDAHIVPFKMCLA
jgi:hypothetical protein